TNTPTGNIRLLINFLDFNLTSLETCCAVSRCSARMKSFPPSKLHASWAEATQRTPCRQRLVGLPCLRCEQPEFGSLRMRGTSLLLPFSNASALDDLKTARSTEGRA